MVIFHSYVSLSEGNQRTVCCFGWILSKVSDPSVRSHFWGRHSLPSNRKTWEGRRMWEQNVRIGEMNLCISLDIFGDSQINRVFLVSKMGIRDVFFNRDGSSWIQLHDWPFVEVNRDKYTIITTLLAPLTPPGGKKCNIHYYIFIPP